MKHTVLVSAKASRDVDAIYLWLEARSPDGAERWYEAWLAAMNSLETAAGTCTVALESKSLGFELRQAFFQTRSGRRYRALFVIKGDQVQVLCVRGPRQNLASSEDVGL